MSQKQTLVVGMGDTGFSIARYLYEIGQTFALFDTRLEPPRLAEFRKSFPEVKLFLGDVPHDFFSLITELVVSPGVPLSNPVIMRAKSLNISVQSDITYFARVVDTKVVAITGTNGKSTVSTLLFELLKAAGKKVCLAGNIGIPVLDSLRNNRDCEYWVLELSSFQLEITNNLQPTVAAILNISPDHLDRHKTLQAYQEAKHRIYSNAKYIVFNQDDLRTIPKDTSQAIAFSLEKSTTWSLIDRDGSTYLAFKGESLICVDELKIKGRHNWANALASAAIASKCGVGLEVILNVLKDFPGLSHRCQWVRCLQQVDWINDSKGTNVGACISALSGIGGSMQGKIVLIAGGQGKGADFSELSEAVAAFARCVVVIGEDAAKIIRALAGTVPLLQAQSMEDAVAIAKVQAKPGDAVLLSPACASFDMFRDFNHRGEVFTKAVQAL